MQWKGVSQLGILSWNSDKKILKKKFCLEAEGKQKVLQSENEAKTLQQSAITKQKRKKGKKNPNKKNKTTSRKVFNIKELD